MGVGQSANLGSSVKALLEEISEIKEEENEEDEDESQHSIVNSNEPVQTN